MERDLKAYKRTITVILSIITAILCVAQIKADAQPKISDADIASKLENQFYNDPSLSAQMVDVTAKEGIVKLDGTVYNLLAKDRLAKLARSIKGVRGVIDEIRVKAPHVGDQELKQDVLTALRNDPATEPIDIDVTADNGEITLYGAVESWQEKNIADNVTKSVRGVTQVNNELAFRWKNDRADKEIKADIRERLRYDFRVDDGAIEVEVDKGNVRLSGNVGSASEKHQAEVDAYVANVDTVDVSALNVRPWMDDKAFIKAKYAVKSDINVRKAVSDAFAYDARVNKFNLDVKVDSGVVTLSGTVNNLMAKKAATRDAKNVVGVLSVNNNLKVRPPKIMEDTQLADEVQERFAMDPFLSLYDINVYATNSKVMLSGEVSSAFEKMRAEIVAAKTNGVASVQNMIKVTGLYYHTFELDALSSIRDVEPQFDIADDLDIKRQVASQIWWSPYVDRDEVDISVKNGVVTLTGMVDSRKEKKYAALNALEGGAKRVENDLLVNNQ